VKCLMIELATAMVVFMAALPGRVFAGVVMSETSFANGLNSEITSQGKMVYVQGNKQKVESGNIATITDLDKNVIYIVDKDQRVYSEMPLQALGSAQPDVRYSEATLTKTGETRIVANHPCNEYRAVKGNKAERVTISACVSTSAPGAKEMAEFDRKIVARLSGRKSDSSGGNDTAGLMLEKQSVLSFRLPDPSRSNAYQTASLLTGTRVNNIQLKPLPPGTFEPPKGYSKLQDRPCPTAPPGFVNSTKFFLQPGTIPVVRVNSPFDPFQSEQTVRHGAQKA
jgi:Domain of unknown function (DUF4412)